MRPVWLWLIAAIAALVGCLAVAAGVILLVVFGPDGTYSSSIGAVRSSGPAAAVIADVVAVDGSPVSSDLATVIVGARSLDGRPIFVGLAPADDVDAYLRGRPYDVLREPGSTGQRLVPVPGTGTPDDPTEQRFWQASAVGTTARVELALHGRGRTLVVMNADGSPAVAVELQVGLTAGWIFPVAIVAVVLGAMLVVAAVLLARAAVARRGQRHAAAAAYPAPGPAPLAGSVAAPLAGSVAGSLAVAVPPTPPSGPDAPVAPEPVDAAPTEAIAPVAAMTNAAPTNAARAVHPARPPFQPTQFPPHRTAGPAARRP
ncbi:MAG: hypothetical protein EPO13_07495 [Actinomycetota bacterium]|nr:MAG: hypothetical protein EPO13_07495 [Actinomycetota bacterium]